MLKDGRLPGLPEPGHPDSGAGRRDPLEESELHSDLVFDGNMLQVRRDRVRLPDGREANREYIQHPGAVVVVAVLDDGCLVMERQFRYPLRRSFIEFPAGKLDPGEDILACARRELREETGYDAASWQHLGQFHPCLGYSSEGIEIFLARQLVQRGNALDDGEFLEVFSMSVAEVLEGVHDGRITDGKTIVALLRALPVLNGERAS